MSVGIFQAQSAAAPPAPSFGFDPSFDLLSSDSLGNMGAKLGAYTGVTLIAPASNPFVPTQNKIVALGTTQVFTMANSTTLTAFTMSFQKGFSTTKQNIATLSTANPNLNLGQYDHIAWKASGNYLAGQDAPLVVIAGDGVGGGGGIDPDEGLGGGIPGGGLGGGFAGGGGGFVPGGGGFGDPGGGFGGGGGVPLHSVEIDLITLMNTNTGAITVPLFWLWIAGGIPANNVAGETLKAVFTATNSAGTAITTEKTWVTQ